MMKTILILTLGLFLCMQGVKAEGHQYYWCGSPQTLEACTAADGKPVRFADYVVHYAIDPRMPYRQAIHDRIEEFNGQIHNLLLVFDGYIDPGLSYTGIILVDDRHGHSIFSSAYGVTQYETSEEHDDYFEVKLSISKLTKRLYNDYVKNKPKTKKASEAYADIALHELCHGLGLGHNNGESLMSTTYVRGRELADDEFEILENLYTESLARRLRTDV